MEKGSLRGLSYCKTIVIWLSEPLYFSTRMLTCVLGNAAKVGGFKTSCFCAQLYCSHRPEVTGLLSVLQLQEQ